MKKSYYISKAGKLMNSAIFGEPYLLISCGSRIKFKKEKVKEFLSNDITYIVNISEKSIAEIHHNTMLFNRSGYSGIRNIPSELSVEMFLKLIK